MKLNPYSITIDGSNDLGVEKMNPFTSDASQRMIVTRFLDMCITTGTCVLLGILHRVMHNRNIY